VIKKRLKKLGTAPGLFYLLFSTAGMVIAVMQLSGTIEWEWWWIAALALGWISTGSQLLDKYIR
jgi:hypothetical protein